MDLPFVSWGPHQASQPPHRATVVSLWGWQLGLQSRRSWHGSGHSASQPSGPAAWRARLRWLVGWGALGGGWWLLVEVGQIWFWLTPTFFCPKTTHVHSNLRTRLKHSLTNNPQKAGRSCMHTCTQELDIHSHIFTHLSLWALPAQTFVWLNILKSSCQLRSRMKHKQVERSSLRARPIHMTRYWLDGSVFLSNEQEWTSKIRPTKIPCQVYQKESLVFSGSMFDSDFFAFCGQVGERENPATNQVFASF